MNNQIDFLKPGVKQIRHQIKSIVESYSHDWDLIAELAQNSVDAIALQKPIRGRIELTVLASERKIIFKRQRLWYISGRFARLINTFLIREIWG